MSTTESVLAVNLRSELPELLVQIEANWPLLPSGIINTSSLQKLSSHLRELARRSEQAGVTALHQKVLLIEDTISRAFHGGTPTNDNQIKALNSYRKQLWAFAGNQHASAAEKTVKPAPKQEPPPFEVTYQEKRQKKRAPPFDVTCLLASEEETEDFTQNLNANSMRCHVASTLEAIQPILAIPGTKALLVDAAFLGTPTIEPILNLLKVDSSKAPALFIIYDQSTIELRLKAMHAGAAQLFPKPVNFNRLIDSLQAHIHPRPKPRNRVLIVDDDEAQALFAAKLLQKGGMDTLKITDPMSFFEVVERFQPDLILIDLYMPGTDGIEVTWMIRDHWRSSSIPIIFLSGENNPDRQLLALLAGADDFLTKPVRPLQLLATVNTRIDRARQIAESAVKQDKERFSRPTTRRELLSRLDLALTGRDKLWGFRALLVICFADPSSDFKKASGKVCGVSDQSITDAILPLLQKDDILANLASYRLGLLYRRGTEIELENLANRLYETLSSVQSDPDQGRIGIGMLPLHKAEGSVYEQLCHAETSAESAYQQRVCGFKLHGEETIEVAAESLDDTTTRREALLRSILEDSIPLPLQRYNCLCKNGVETYELLPLLSSLPLNEDPYQSAAACGASGEFDRFVCQRALQKLRDWIAQGHTRRLILRQSAAALKQPDYLEFVNAELHRYQISGTGLMMEFDLPSIANHLKDAKHLFDELATLGIAVVLRKFSCIDTAYKLLAYLQPDAIRPLASQLHADREVIEQITSQVHALHAAIILPRVARHSKISLHWKEFADYIQSDFSG